MKPVIEYQATKCLSLWSDLLFLCCSMTAKTRSDPKHILPTDVIWKVVRSTIHAIPLRWCIIWVLHGLVVWVETHVHQCCSRPCRSLCVHCVVSVYSCKIRSHPGRPPSQQGCFQTWRNCVWSSFLLITVWLKLWQRCWPYIKCSPNSSTLSSSWKIACLQ